MQSIDTVGAILILIGSITVYGSKYIMKLLKIEINDNRILISKLIGLVISCIGVFRILK